ncbi:MAG TPA: IS110 family transposase, partial [Vicinamibacteria bacterium]|nr:IS110 family transposase [Vicinamibacteria bacterium]
MLECQVGALSRFPKSPNGTSSAPLLGVLAKTTVGLGTSGSPPRTEQVPMRFAGIDVGSRSHVIAIVSETGEVLLRPTSFGEDAVGYAKLLGLLGPSDETLVAMEATGHYGRNLFAALCEKGYQVAVINPLRTRRFAEENLVRAKNDSIDALGIARFAAQKRPAASITLDAASEELRERVRFYDRLSQDCSDRVRQLHRLVHLCFPEFTRHVRGLDSRRAIAILKRYSSARTFNAACLPRLAELRYDGHHFVGR